MIRVNWRSQVWLIAVLGITSTPIHAQNCQQPWMWGCYYQPQYPSYQQPRQESTSPRPRHHTRYTVRRERREPPTPVVHRTPAKPKVIYRDRENTWEGLDQDKAREWIKQQVQSFCGKYPKDEACVKRE